LSQKLKNWNIHVSKVEKLEYSYLFSRFKIAKKLQVAKKKDHVQLCKNAAKSLKLKRWYLLVTTYLPAVETEAAVQGN